MKKEQKAAEEAREARRNDPEYQKRLIRKITINSMYGVTCNPQPIFISNFKKS